MSAKILRMVVVAAVCCCGNAVAGEPRQAPASDTAGPYKANRLSSPQASEPILNIPGQTTVLTREVLDDMKATSLKDALRSTAGVTIGR